MAARGCGGPWASAHEATQRASLLTSQTSNETAVTQLVRSPQPLRVKPRPAGITDDGVRSGVSRTGEGGVWVRRAMGQCAQGRRTRFTSDRQTNKQRKLCPLLNRVVLLNCCELSDAPPGSQTAECVLALPERARAARGCGAHVPCQCLVVCGDQVVFASSIQQCSMLGSAAEITPAQDRPTALNRSRYYKNRF